MFNMYNYHQMAKDAGTNLVGYKDYLQLKEQLILNKIAEKKEMIALIMQDYFGRDVKNKIFQNKITMEFLGIHNNLLSEYDRNLEAIRADIARITINIQREGEYHDHGPKPERIN